MNKYSAGWVKSLVGGMFVFIGSCHSVLREEGHVVNHLVKVFTSQFTVEICHLSLSIRQRSVTTGLDGGSCRRSVGITDEGWGRLMTFGGLRSDSGRRTNGASVRILAAMPADKSEDL